MNIQTKLATLVLSTVATSMQFSSSVQAQVINFETLPDGTPSTDNQALLAPYTLTNGTIITFGFDVNNDLIIDYNGRIESRTDGNNSFSSYTSGNIPDLDKTPNKSGGNFLLRPPLSTNLEGANLNIYNNFPGATRASFLAKYTGTPVNSLSGELWDIDYGERYLVEALTTGGTLINSFITPAIPNGEGPATFDGLPYKISFSNLSQDIGFLRISGYSRIGGGRFAFDNFDATGATIEPVPEPTTLLSSALAVGFGAYLRKKNSRQLQK